MKIGILTFHRAINYGAFLQALALKTYLTSLGCKVDIIDYWPEGHADAYRLFPNFVKKRPIIKKMKFLLSLSLRYERAKKRRNKMQELIKKHFGLAEVPKYPTPESLINVSYDCIIYGSDQIWWNSTIPDYKGYDSVYWGEYIPKDIMKITYAPSMGVINLNEEIKNRIQKWLNNFEKLSVREIGLYESIKDLTDKNISVVLDPVFLLPTAEWERYCIPIKRSKYILYYNLIPSKEADKMADIMAKKMHCDIIEITGLVHAFKFGKRYIQTADAIEFISLIKNASFVITSSFHGTAFSLIFKKQFYAIGMGKRSGRVESLLNQLGISERIITDMNVLPEKNIDYLEVNDKLQSSIVNSKKFLLEAINI